MKSTSNILTSLHDAKTSESSQQLCLSSKFKNLDCLPSQANSLLKLIFNTNDPGHEKMCLMSYANNKGADQPVHPRSLISDFVVRCRECVMSLVSVTKISSLMLASVTAQTGLCLAW